MDDGRIGRGEREDRRRDGVDQRVPAQAEPHGRLEWRERIEGDLRRRGVDPPFAARVLPFLDALPSQLSPEQYEGVLAGVQVAFAAHREAGQELRRSTRRLTDVERILPVFAAELKRLEEALKVLNAFVLRLQPRDTTDSDSVLH